MKKDVLENRMKSNSRHPGRVLFSGAEGPGLLLTIVAAEYKKSPNEREPDYETVIDAWSEYECPNVTKLIGDIVSKPGLAQIGHEEIDLDGVARGRSSARKARLLQSLYIGNPALKISPLRWLLYLSRGFGKVPVTIRPTFDKVAGILARNSGLPLPDEIWDGFN